MSTKGYVYLMETYYTERHKKKDGTPYYKIGKSIKVSERTKQIKLQLPWPVRPRHTIASGDYSAAEKYLQAKYEEFKLNGEWYDLPDSEIAWICSLQDGAIDILMGKPYPPEDPAAKATAPRELVARRPSYPLSRNIKVEAYRPVVPSYSKPPSPVSPSALGRPLPGWKGALVRAVANGGIGSPFGGIERAVGGIGIGPPMVARMERLQCVGRAVKKLENTIEIPIIEIDGEQ